MIFYFFVPFFSFYFHNLSAAWAGAREQEDKREHVGARDAGGQSDSASMDITVISARLRQVTPFSARLLDASR